MKKILFASVVILALILVYGSTELMACGMKGKPQVSEFTGAPVKNLAGEEVGLITDVMTDPDSQAAFAIVAYGPEDMYGLGRRMIVLPFAILSCAGADCVVSVEKESLDSAPFSHQKRLLSRKRWQQTIIDTSDSNLTGRRKTATRWHRTFFEEMRVISLSKRNSLALL